VKLFTVLCSYSVVYRTEASAFTTCEFPKLYTVFMCVSAHSPVAVEPFPAPVDDGNFFTCYYKTYHAVNEKLHLTFLYVVDWIRL